MISNKRIFYYLFFVSLSTTISLVTGASSSAQPRAPASMDKSKPVPMRYWAKSPPVKEKLPLRIGHHAAKMYLNISPQNMKAIGTTFLANQMEPHSFMFTFITSSVFKFSDVYSTLFQSTESVEGYLQAS